MALQISFESKFGVTHPAAYARVSGGSWRGTSGSASIDVYADKAARDAGKTPIESMGFSFPLDLNDASNIVAQAYAYLKTRDEFAGATDV